MSRPPLPSGRAAPRRAPLLLLSALAAAFLAGCGADHADLGRRRYEARDYHGAIEELNWAVQRNPDDVRSRYLLAKAQSRTSHRFDAKANFQQCRKHPEFHAGASQSLALLLAAEKSFDQADALVTEELAAAPEDPTWIELRGIVTLKRLEFETQELVKAIQPEVGEAIAKGAVGRLTRYRGAPAGGPFANAVSATAADLANRHGVRDTTGFTAAAGRLRDLALKAQADFTAAATKDPKRFRALTELGSFAVERNDTPAAQKHLAAAVAIDDATLPDAESKIAYSEQHVRAVDLLSGHLEAVGRIQESVALLEDEHARGMLEGPMQERLGRQYAATKQFEKAGVIADALLENDPKNTWANFLRGVVSFEGGRFEDAVTYLNRAQVQLPSHPTINTALARALVKTGRHTQAAAHFGLALVGPNATDVDLTLEYARTIARESDASQAALMLEDRLRTVFKDPASPAHQRIIDEIRKLSAEAGIGAENLADARSALAAHPDNVFAKLTVAKLEHEQGLSSIALPRCREVTEQYPGLADGWLLTAQILSDLDRGDEATPAIKKAVALRPGDPNIPWLQGRIAMKRNRLDDARRSLAAALELEPALAGARLDLVELELRAKNFDAARKHCETLCEKYPGDPRVHRALGFARLATGDAKGAIEPLAKAAAALPADGVCKVKLAAARVEAGQAEQGRDELVAIARDPKVSKEVRREAADALSAARFHAEAAEAYNSQLGGAATEAERSHLSDRVFWAHVRAGNPASALDELVRMRLSERKVQAERAFVVAAERAGFHREAAAQADALRAADGHDLESLRSAFRAHAGLKQWPKAIEDLDDLGRLKPDLAPELKIDRAQALLGLGKVTEAVQAASQAAPRGKPQVLRALRLQLDIAIARSDAAAVEQALQQIVAETPADAEARIDAARALVALDKTDTAALVLSSAPFKTPDMQATVTAAGILVAAQDTRRAATLLDASPNRGVRVVNVRALVALLLGEAPATPTPFSNYLARIASKDFDGARDAVKDLPEPESVKDQWRAIAATIESTPALAESTALDLARARIFTESRVLVDRGAAILRNLADKATPPRGASYDAVRAWWKLECGDAKAAADVAVPMLENKASSTMVTLVAALAGLELTGENAALRLLEPGAAASSDALVSDVFHALAAKGLHAAALRAYAKLPNPSERDKALRLLIAVERRDRNAAREALAALPPDFRKRPSVKAAQLWTDVQGDKTRAASAAEIKALSGQPRELDRVDAVVLYEAALLGGLSAEASAILADGLAKARFDAERINRFAEVLRRIQTDKNTLQILEDRLRVVDPTGKIRAPAPRPLDVD